MTEFKVGDLVTCDREGLEGVLFVVCYTVKYATHEPKVRCLSSKVLSKNYSWVTLFAEPGVTFYGGAYTLVWRPEGGSW